MKKLLIFLSLILFPLLLEGQFINARSNYVAPVVAASSYPAVLDDGNTVLWLDFAKGVTISGVDVTTWGDQTTNGNDLVQGTADRCPHLTADGILFDGSNDAMKAVAFTLEQPTRVYMVMRVVNWVDNKYFIDGNAETSLLIASFGTEPDIILYAGSLGGSVHVTEGTFEVIRALFNGASSSLQVNGNAAWTGDPGSNDAGGFTVGARANQITENSNIEVKEIIVRNVDDSTGTDEADIYNYLKNKYGL